MKLHHLIVVAAIAIFVFPVESIAQERLFGNGRFLRRLRDDLTGHSRQPKPRPNPLAVKKPTPPKANANARTSPVKPRAGVPTPARRPVANNVPTPASRNVNKIKVPTPNVPKLHTPNLAQPKAPPIVSGGKLPMMATKSADKPTKNFGMFLQTKNEKLIVTQLDPNGNANKAGVRRGDVIKGAGGIDLTNMQEFNEITEVLSQGDQLEFVVDRSGKEKEMLIMFGKGPDIKDGEVIEPAETVRSKPANQNRNYEFVPKPTGQRFNSNNGMQSVIQTSRNEPSVQQAPRVNSNIVEQQRMEIERMRREIERLRQSQPANGNTILSVPSLSGPGG